MPSEKDPWQPSNRDFLLRQTLRSVSTTRQTTYVTGTEGGRTRAWRPTHIAASLQQRRDPAFLAFDRSCTAIPGVHLKAVMLDSGSGFERFTTNSKCFWTIEMRLSRKEVEYVAGLARLGLTNEEVSRLQDQLSSILDHISALETIDTGAIPPTASVVTLSTVLRPDVVTSSLTRSEVLANAPRQADGFFEVHAVLGSTEDTSN